MRPIDILGDLGEILEPMYVSIKIENKHRLANRGWVVGIGHAKLKFHVHVVELELNDMKNPSEVLASGEPREQAQ